MIISRIFFFPQGGQEKEPPKSLMRWENIGVNVKKNLWKVFPQPQKPDQACRKAVGCTNQPKQTRRENMQHIGALQTLVRQGSCCRRSQATPARASGPTHLTFSPQRQISACPQMHVFCSAHTLTYMLNARETLLLVASVIRRCFCFPPACHDSPSVRSSAAMTSWS